MLIAAIFLAITIGWIRGGKIARLADFNLAFPGLIIAAFLIQAVISGMSSIPFAGYRFSLLIVSYLMLLWALSRNKFSWGMAITILGVFLNFLVILVNGGMPVSPTAMRIVGYAGDFSALWKVENGVHEGVHVLMQPATRLSWLADIIPQPLPSPFGGVLSPGDILLALGVLLVIQSNMLYVGRRRINRVKGNG